MAAYWPGKNPSRNRSRTTLRVLTVWSMASALARASASRTPSGLRTTQVTVRSGACPISFRTVPPHPISMSSACASTQRRCRPGPASASRLNARIASRPRGPWRDRGAAPRPGLAQCESVVLEVRVSVDIPMTPDFPRGGAPAVQGFQELPVPEGVHAGPEPVHPIGEELARADEPLERCFHQVLAVSDVVEDGRLEHEEPAVDPEAGLLGGPDVAHRAVGVHRDHVEGAGRSHTEETADLVGAAELFDVAGKIEVTQAVAVVGEKGGLVLDVGAHRP